MGLAVFLQSKILVAAFPFFSADLPDNKQK